MSAAVEIAPRRPWITWAFNPFHYVAGGQALGIGLAVMLIAGAVNGVSHSHFDGLLDFHTGGVSPWWLYWVEGPINWIVATVLLYVAGRLIASGSFRFIDVAGTQALARVPLLLCSLAQLPPMVQAATKRVVEAAMNVRDPSSADVYFAEMNMVDLAIVVAVGLWVLVMVVWMVALMYRAFAVSCNVSGGKAVGVFIAAIVIGEIVTKAIFIGLYSASGM